MTHRPASEPSLEWWRAGRIDAGPINRASPRVLFGQVYEDPAVELAALAAAPAPRRAMCIASGGETALSLLTGAPERVSAVDINPAQIALVRLKVAAVRRLSREQAIRCLDLDARPWYSILREDLEPEPRSFWDAHQADLARGLSHCGFVDRRLRRAMGVFRLLVHHEHTIRNLLTLADVSAQAAYYRARWRSITWRLLFALAFARPVLSLLYRRGVLRSLPSEFGTLIERRFERALLSGPARDNGYLWQVLLGRFPPGSEAGLPPCLRADLYPVLQNHLGRLQLARAEVAGWLRQQAPRSLDLVALSNITEVTSSAYVAQLGEALAHAGSPGALVVLRWIFPPPDPAADPLTARLRPDPSLTVQFERLDRSLICTFLRVYRCPG